MWRLREDYAYNNCPCRLKFPKIDQDFLGHGIFHRMTIHIRIIPRQDHWTAKAFQLGIQQLTTGIHTTRRHNMRSEGR